MPPVNLAWWTPFVIGALCGFAIVAPFIIVFGAWMFRMSAGIRRIEDTNSAVVALSKRVKAVEDSEAKTREEVVRLGGFPRIVTGIVGGAAL